MEINMLKEVKVDIKKCHIYTKICDELCFTLVDQFGAVICEQDHDYVPGFLGDDGDYLDLEIDIDTGQILNWKKPTEEELNELIDKLR